MHLHLDDRFFRGDERVLARVARNVPQPVGNESWQVHDQLPFIHEHPGYGMSGRLAGEPAGRPETAQTEPRATLTIKTRQSDHKNKEETPVDYA